jgi:hypothetical protein
VIYRIAADAVVLVHFAFIVFVALGALLALRWRWVTWLHIPALLWGVLVETTGRLCPLTDLENALRTNAGQSGYRGGFIEHYIPTLLYPDGLSRSLQFVLAAVVLAVNVIIYWKVLKRRRPGTGPDRLNT